MDDSSCTLVNTYGFRIPAAADSWSARVEAGCRVLEARFGAQLNLAAAGTKYRSTVKAVTNRATFFKQRLKTKGRGFGLSNGRHGGESVRLGGNMIYGLDAFTVNVYHPDRGLPFTEEVFVALGDATEAYSSQMTPRSALDRLAKAQWHAVWEDKVTRVDPGELTPEERRLPPIAQVAFPQTPDLLSPHHLGWINYWSEEVCEYVGFPAVLAGHPVLDDCYRTPRGAWLVKLGREPFEPRNAAHLELLRQMYERFPRVGMRIADGVAVHDVPDPVLASDSGLR